MPRQTVRRAGAAAAAFVLFTLTPASTQILSADPEAIQRSLNETVGQISKIQAEQGALATKSERFEVELAKSEETIKQRTALLKARAAYLYRAGGGGEFLTSLITSQSTDNFMKRIRFLDFLGDRDSKLVDGLVVARDRADELRADIRAARARQAKLLEQMKSKRSQLENQLKGAQSAAKVAKYGKFDAFTLPMSPSGFTDSWGDPRSGGRRHKGTDVFGACGQAVKAVTNATVTDMHSGGSGGIMMWIRAGNGDVFFYSHLRGYAVGVSEGRTVGVGEVIAYNGNSGNARGGPCHVHFEWHPGGGAPVNPYSLLAAAR